MNMSIGKNTIQGKRLLEIIEQSEVYDAEKKDISGLNTALMAAAKAEGFNPKIVNILKRRRRMKPHDRQEGDDLFHAYSHAIGMDDEPPLFRAISEMARDTLTREVLLESFKELAPPEGDIILRMGGEPVRVYRDKDGIAHVEPYVEKAAKREPGAPKASTAPARTAREVPDSATPGRLPTASRCSATTARSSKTRSRSATRAGPNATKAFARKAAATAWGRTIEL